VRLQSFYRSADKRVRGWRLGNIVVVPAALVRVLLPLLDQAATQAAALPGALPDQTIGEDTTDSPQQ
jgi:hypothetical protein